MYVTSFLERINCGFSGAGGGGGGTCSSCFRVNECEEHADDGNGKNVGRSIKGDTNKVNPELERKRTKKIEIMPVELVSCTNNKLVSSSKCLNVDN